ncbi:hypothetical protein LTR95_015536 [Oleoguttula sp. CCFEE 5521]
MFVWYRRATRCYVYLSDVSTGSWQTAFRKSRWFTRSWTLQELLAPPSVELFSVEGVRLGDKKTLQDEIHDITGIPIAALEGEDLSNFSVTRRLAWAEHRKARRREDRAYSLLGIFGVFMTLIYGEGDHAFIRLRAKIGDVRRINEDHIWWEEGAQERPNYDRQYDSDCESDAGNSIFSAYSTGSTNTAMSVLLEQIPTKTLDYFISCVFCTEDLVHLYAAASADFTSTNGRLKGNLRRLVRSLGRDLRQEVDKADGLQSGIVRLLSSRSVSSRVAEEVVEWAYGPNDDDWVRNLGSDDDASVSSSDDGGNASPLDNSQIDRITELLVNSRSFAQYKQQLTEFAHQPYENQVLKALYKGPVLSSGHCLDEAGVAAVAYELSWMPMGQFVFTSPGRSSIQDRFKRGSRKPCAKAGDGGR